jgi:hypothetical protein
VSEGVDGRLFSRDAWGCINGEKFVFFTSEIVSMDWR